MFQHWYIGKGERRRYSRLSAVKELARRLDIPTSRKSRHRLRPKQLGSAWDKFVDCNADSGFNYYGDYGSDERFESEPLFEQSKHNLFPGIGDLK